MAIAMFQVRRQVLEAFGIQYKGQNYYKLPAEFSTHPLMVTVRVMEYGSTQEKEYLVKVLSQKEAKEVSKTKARRPQRILVWCYEHQRWIFAGKYCQHAKLTHGKEKK